jgi:hypothetical protein
MEAGVLAYQDIVIFVAGIILLGLFYVRHYHGLTYSIHKKMLTSFWMWRLVKKGQIGRTRMRWIMLNVILTKICELDLSDTGLCETGVSC